MQIRNIYTANGYFDDKKIFIVDKNYLSFILEGSSEGSLGFFYYNVFTKNLASNELSENYFRILDIISIITNAEINVIEKDCAEYALCVNAFQTAQSNS